MEQWYLLVISETSERLSRPFHSSLSSAKRMAEDLAGQLRRPVDLYCYRNEDWIKSETVQPCESLQINS
jgi:hypothetical protein